MILISHRGNLDNPNPEKENHPDYIKKALQSGFNVEIDVWSIDNQFYLGHDKPQYPVHINFFYNQEVNNYKHNNYWCHAKNIEALEHLLSIGAHCFWHQTDDVVLTSKNFLWTYPGKPLGKKNAIAVMPEIWDDIYGVAGICSDNIMEIKSKLIRLANKI